MVSWHMGLDNLGYFDILQTLFSFTVLNNLRHLCSSEEEPTNSSSEILEKRYLLANKNFRT